MGRTVFPHRAFVMLRINRGMMGLFRKLLMPTLPTHINLVGTGKIRASMERLNDSFTLHLSGEALIDDNGGTAHFDLTVSDTESLKALCAMVSTVTHAKIS